ncbi:LemA family protein [Gottschalkiaceae bacterium SANA]|nr:LemA family protein [Gottschalkiaceae bacterium SANA]
MGIFIGLGVVVVIIGFVISLYNRLAKLNVNVEESFSSMDVYLKKRYDLIPNLVETVKGYASHEKETLERVIRARNSAMSATDPGEVLEANNQLAMGLKSIFALAESYPDLKANEGFVNLQNQLTKIEEDISNARLYYNGNVKIFNKAIVVFPNVIIANMMGFEKKPFFEIEEAERETVRVQF